MGGKSQQYQLGETAGEKLAVSPGRTEASAEPRRVRRSESGEKHGRKQEERTMPEDRTGLSLPRVRSAEVGG